MVSFVLVAVHIGSVMVNGATVVVDFIVVVVDVFDVVDVVVVVVVKRDVMGNFWRDI